MHSYNNYIINPVFTLLILRIFPLNFAIFQTKNGPENLRSVLSDPFSFLSLYLGSAGRAEGGAGSKFLATLGALGSSGCCCRCRSSCGLCGSLRLNRCSGLNGSLCLRSGYYYISLLSGKGL